jgi:hypothetical protein
MPTVDSRDIVDAIIKGNGVYPGDEHIPPCAKIVQYTNFHGGACYGLIYAGQPLNLYEESRYINNPITIWERKES